MANEFKIKTGLLIGASTNASVTSIKDTSISITTDASSLLVTGKAVYDFVQSNQSPSYWSLDGSILAPSDDSVDVQLSAIQVGTDAGTVTVIDMDVSDAAVGVVQSYAFNIDGTPIAKVYAEGDGAAGIQEASFKVLETLYAESSIYFTGIPDVSTSYVLFYDPTSDEVTYASESAISGVTQLSALTDVSIGGSIPDGSALVYDSAASKWTYSSMITAISWGDIGGSISNQTDLYNPWLVDLSTNISNKLDNTTDTFTGILTIDGSIVVADITASGDVGISGDTAIAGNVAIGGDLTVDGSLYITNTETIDVSAAFIHLNTGLVGTPPAWMQSGLVIERGDQDPYAIIFDEDQETFRIGISPKDGSLFDDASTQAVATREDSPVDLGIAYWNNTLNRFDTSIHLRYSGGNLLVNNDISVGSQIFAPNLTASSQPALVFWNDSTGEFTQADASTIGLDTSTFISLFDTPNTYLDGSSGSAVVMNDAGDGLEFGSRIWREESDEVTLANENANVLFYQYIELEADAGIATFVDKDVTASSAIGTEETYRFNMDGTTIAEIYAESNGAGGIQEQKFISNATFQAEASVYMTAIPEVSTGYTLYYDPVTDQVTYAEASLGGGGGGDPVNQVTDGIVYWNGTNYDTSSGYTVGEAGNVVEFGLSDVSIQDRTSVNTMRFYYQNNLFLSTTNSASGLSYMYGPQSGSISLGGPSNVFFVDSSSIAMGNLADFNTYFTVQDTNATPDTILAKFKTEYSDALDIYNTGQIFCPSIGSGTTSNVIFFNDTTGEITYGSSPSGSLAGLSDVSVGGLGAAQDGSALVYNHAQAVWEYGVAGGGGDYWTLDGSTLVPTDDTVDVKLGEINVDTDAGAVTLVDMEVTSTPVAGTEESYAFNIDGSTVAKIWSEADSAGTLQEYGFVVETAQYMGDPNTNGSWRFYPDSNGDLVFEKRISGTWTEKGKFTE